MTIGVSLLQGIVLVCSLLYKILDIREELREIRMLEAKVTYVPR